MEGPRLAENWYLGGARSPARRCVERGVEADLNCDAGKDTAKKAVTVRVVVKKGCPGGRGLCVPGETGEDDSQEGRLGKEGGHSSELIPRREWLYTPPLFAQMRT